MTKRIIICLTLFALLFAGPLFIGMGCDKVDDVTVHIVQIEDGKDCQEYLENAND